MIDIYGRQWFPPETSHAFDRRLVTADELVIDNRTEEACFIYKEIKDSCSTAKRRLETLRLHQKRLVSNGAVDPLLAITFCDWYQGFNVQDNFLTHFLRAANIGFRITTVHEADVIVAGCYGNSLLQLIQNNPGRIVLFVSGENIYPSYSVHDFSLTTLRNDFSGKNARLPQWLCELAEKTPNGKYLEGILARQHCHSTDHKRRFLFSAVYNNSTPQREEVLGLLRREFGEENIHVFGSQRSGPIDKDEVLRNSVVNVCFENSIGPGYVTEKLMDALINGCSALYWGDPSYREDFVDSKVLNVFEATSSKMIIEWCKLQLDLHAKNKLNRSSESIFSVEPNAKDAIRLLRRVQMFTLGIKTLTLNHQPRHT